MRSLQLALAKFSGLASTLIAEGQFPACSPAHPLSSALAYILVLQTCGCSSNDSVPDRLGGLRVQVLCYGIPLHFDYEDSRKFS